MHAMKYTSNPPFITVSPVRAFSLVDPPSVCETRVCVWCVCVCCVCVVCVCVCGVCTIDDHDANGLTGPAAVMRETQEKADTHTRTHTRTHTTHTHTHHTPHTHTHSFRLPPLNVHKVYLNENLVTYLIRFTTWQDLYSQWHLLKEQ